MSSDNDLPTFRPFSREELAEIENRIFEKKLIAKKRAEKMAKNVAVSNIPESSTSEFLSNIKFSIFAFIINLEFWILICFH
jgi:hypothetical protein